MKTKVLSTIQQHQMFTQGAVLLVAVSGGADSVALLHFLRELREEWNLTLRALHLNHNLRGAESDADEAFVRKLCADWDIPLIVECADVAARAAKTGESIEVAARNCRYEFFEREGRAHQAKVATAHTCSDNGETVLLNLIRGTALRGLTGIAPVRGRYIRPLIACTRQEIEAYCQEHNLSYVTDSTNHSDAYTRNRIRRHIMPLLEQENPRLAEGLARMCEILRQDADYLDEQAETAFVNLQNPERRLNRQEFLQLPGALKGRVLALLLRREGLEADGRTIQNLSYIIQEGTGAWQLSDRVRFRCREKEFWLEQVVAPLPFFSVKVPAEQIRDGAAIRVYDGKEVKFWVKYKENFIKSQNIHKKALTYSLDYDRIGKILILRQRLPSDRLRLPGRGCSKTLKNLFQEKQVPASQRLRRVVLESAGRVLWVEGIGPDESVAVSNATERILMIEVTEGPHEREDRKSSN